MNRQTWFAAIEAADRSFAAKSADKVSQSPIKIGCLSLEARKSRAKQRESV